ncbi:hypothetical protein [Sphingomonas sp. PP-CE-3G-477]|uniref:hypothetical protein n=1 Tax=Sphingomonas sp. PP-CE-3G-477 TaxID=2135660 RepID=UPI0011B2271F|nr:hypothetical protein [Sphingomonas sp. PP-CE-3G-477]
MGLEGVESALVFIGQHPDLDYGAPGELVHFMEEFYRKGFEEALVKYFLEKPTPLTAWMLNRLINGTKDKEECNVYIAAFEKAESDPSTDPRTLSDITHYLNRDS